MPLTDAQLTENKLILLFIIQQRRSVSSIELSDLVLFKGYMDYFTMQELLQELHEAELILEQDAVYTLTEAGQAVVDTFRTRIPNSTRDEITEYVQTASFGRSTMLEPHAEILPNKVRVSITDYDQEIFSMYIPASSEEECYRIRNNWQQKGMIIYRNILSDLRG